MIEPPVVANRPVGPDRALFLSAVLVLSIVAGLGGGMILVLLDTSFSSLTELRDYTGLRVLGAISDARSRAGRRLAEAAMLVVGFAGLAGILVMLLLIERQYGLDTVLAADFTRASLGNRAEDRTRVRVGTEWVSTCRYSG